MRNSATPFLCVFSSIWTESGKLFFELSHHISFDYCNLYSLLYLLNVPPPPCSWSWWCPSSQWAMGREGAASLRKNHEHFLVLRLESQIFPDPVWTPQCFSPSTNPSFQCGRKNWEWFRINLNKVFPSNSLPPMGFPGRVAYNRPLSPNGFIYYFWI